MVSMREAAKKNLDKMVKGAAREVNSSRPGATSARAVQPTGPSLFEQLTQLINKNGRTLQKVPIESIQLHENIRSSYQADELKRLADSLEKEGLIQFPTLCLKGEIKGEPLFVCKNGHRRILAAQSLGWKTIECLILPFASTRDELYHTIAANLREDVFYLDLARAYEAAAKLGESDGMIAERTSINVRTIGWYRRLAAMPLAAESLAREHPQVFHATWAIQLARKGPLPEEAALLPMMQKLLRQKLEDKKDEATEGEPKPIASTYTPEQQSMAKNDLRGLFTSPAQKEEADKAWGLLEKLCVAGYLKPHFLKKLRRQLIKTNKSQARRAASPS